MLTWNGSCQANHEALMDASFAIHKAGLKAVRAALSPHSLAVLAYHVPNNGMVESVLMQSDNVQVVARLKMLDLRRDGAADFWTPFGVIRVEASDAIAPRHATLYDECGAIVCEVTLSS